MIAATIAVRKREASVRALQELIAPHVREYVVYWDEEYQGHWWNLSRCMREVLAAAQPGEPALITCDDVITVPDWHARFEALRAKVQRQIYCLTANRSYLFKPANMERGYTVGTPARCYYDHAAVFYDLPTLMDDVLTWFAGPGATWPGITSRPAGHLDIVIQEYLIAHGIEWVIPCPTIFNHLANMKSTLGHIIAGSPCYVGDMPDAC